jgi:signal transduction histidine kinase
MSEASLIVAALLERQPDPMVLLGSDGAVAFANALAEAVLVDGALGEGAERQALGSAVAAVLAGRPVPELSAAGISWRLERLEIPGSSAMVLARGVDRYGARLSHAELADIVHRVGVGLTAVRVPVGGDPEAMRIELNNPAASEASAAELAPLIGKGFLEAFPMVRDTPFPALYRRVSDGGDPVELPEIRYGDERVPDAVFQVSLQPSAGRIVLGQYVNVTQARRAQARFRQLFEEAPVALLELGVDPGVAEAEGEALDEALGRCEVLDANAQARALLGVVGGAFPDRLLPEVFGRDSDLLKGLASALVSRAVRSAGSCDVPTAHGRPVPCWCTLYVLEPAQGRAILGLTDISELRATQRELERSNRELGQFAQVVSHDLRSPLQSILGFCELLLACGASTSNQQQRRYLESIMRASLRMEDLVEDLLIYAQVDAGAPSLRDVDPREALEGALEDLAEPIRETGARVDHGPMPAVVADPVQLTSVFRNLVGNAVKYRGEVPPRVQVSARCVGSMVRFEISDNGVGIPSDQLENIFQPFHRLPSAQPGTGLGLALVKRMVEQHGGSVEVVSTPGRGSCFRFTFCAAGSARETQSLP